MPFFTFMCGFAQDFNRLFILKALQGLGFGGEWAAGAVSGRGAGEAATGGSLGLAGSRGDRYFRGTRASVLALAFR